MKVGEIACSLNNLILQAVMHGGDLGGPYDSNEKLLVDAMESVSRLFGLGEYFIWNVDVYCIDEQGSKYRTKCLQFVPRVPDMKQEGENET